MFIKSFYRLPSFHLCFELRQACGKLKWNENPLTWIFFVEKFWRFMIKFEENKIYTNWKFSFNIFLLIQNYQNYQYFYKMFWFKRFKLSCISQKHSNVVSVQCEASMSFTRSCKSIKWPFWSFFTKCRYSGRFLDERFVKRNFRRFFVWSCLLDQK